MRWAQHDPEVLANHIGEFVVPFDRRIVAHGRDMESVLEEAARVTGRDPDRLPICSIDDPLLDLPLAIENSVILGMSFLANNDVRLVLDGHGAETNGYLRLPDETDMTGER